MVLKKIFYILLLTLFACAQSSIPLTGGPNDTIAPQLDSSKTVPINGTLNFNDDKMVLAFDEFVVLNKPQANILITPQQIIPATFTSKNKKVNIQFNEPLKKNTTYVFSFNGAIQDLNEKNDSIFQYVFSTGSYIDSLKFNGSIKNGKTNSPHKDLLVGLYPLQDSIVYDSILYKSKPAYITQTNNEGDFNFNYLKSGQYYIFAIEDKNRNLIADDNEPIAFYMDRYIAAGDTNEAIMKSFLPERNECKMDETYFTYPGRISFTSTCPFNNFSVKSNIDLLPEESGALDSLIYWLAEAPSKKMKFVVNNNGISDTLKPFYDAVPDKIEYGKISIEDNLSEGKLLPGENLKLKIGHAVSSIGKYAVLDSDSNEVAIDYKFTAPREITFYTYGTTAASIHIDSAAIKTRYGDYNGADIDLNFVNEDSSFFGKLQVNIDTVFNHPVIVHLTNAKNEIVVDTVFSNILKFENLIPGNYRITLIIDKNSDGKWTTGSIKELKEPEPQITSTVSMTVKSKWDKEIDWNLKVIKENEEE